MRLNVEIKIDVYNEFVKNCYIEGRSISDVIRSLVLKFNRESARRKKYKGDEMLMIGDCNEWD